MMLLGVRAESSLTFWGTAARENMSNMVVRGRADKAAFQTLMRDFLVSLREYNCDQWTQSSLALQLEAQQKESERKQVPFCCRDFVALI